MTLVIATRNAGKYAEIASLLGDLGATLLPLDSLGRFPPLPEDGETIEENAAGKARAVAGWVQRVALADDSGLEVDALGGQPGARAARFAGAGATDADRVARLLARLEGVGAEGRRARFRCAIAVATPAGDLYLAGGSCEGVIATGPRGDQGFGYDPIFVIPEYGKTLAELGPEVKNRISHRARAMAKARDTLRTVLAAEASGQGR